MIRFNNYNGFDTYFLNEFNGLQSTPKNLIDLSEKIVSLYLNDDSIDFSLKGDVCWTIFDLKGGSMLEIFINQ